MLYTSIGLSVSSGFFFLSKSASSGFATKINTNTYLYTDRNNTTKMSYSFYTTLEKNTF